MEKRRLHSAEVTDSGDSTCPQSSQPVISCIMAGYSGKPLAEKLGIVAGSTVAAIGAPANYRELLGPLPDGVRFCEVMRSRN